MVNLVSVARRGVVVLLGAVAAIFTAAPAQACTANVPPLKPAVSIEYIADPLNAGMATFTIEYHFPGTDFSFERGLIFRDNGAVIGGVSTDGADGTSTFGPWSVACRTGVHTFTAEAWSHCNFTDSEHAVDSVEQPFDSKPTVSLELTGPDESGVVTGQLSYDFPNTTDHQSGRQVLTYIDGTYNAEASVAGTDVPLHGSKQITLDTACWSNGAHPVIAFARACGNSDPAFNAQDEQTVTVNHTPSVAITDFEKRPDGTYANVEFNFPQTSNSSQRLLEIRDSKSGTLLGSAHPPTRTGTLPIFMICSAGGPVYATAKACSDPPVINGDPIAPECELSCKTPPLVKADSSSSCCIGDPVHVTSGSMELDDRDPLPGTMVAPLVRTYQSRNPVAGAFGTGWTTIMDARASALGGTDGRDGVFLLLEDGRRAMFRRSSGGAYAQTYPEDTATAGTLVFDTTLGAFVHRDAGSSVSRLFRASDGRLVSLVDRRGDAVTLTYDGSGKATAVADAAGRWSWTVAYGTAGFVESIAVDGQTGLVWTYGYSGGKLVTVTAPQSAAWRTYVYGSAGLEEVHDARDAVVERHTYDAEGRALSSFGPSGDLTAIQSTLAGRVPGETRTHVVSADGKTTDYYSRFIAGRMRTAEVAGSCHCTSEDSVFVHDVEGHVIREQNSRGWITVRTFANGRVATQSTFLRPTSCDPQTDTSRCRQTPDSLASIALQSTASSTTTAFTYGDPNWPERATLVTTDSVVPGQQRQDAFTFDAISGAVLTQTSSGFNPVTTLAIQRTTQTVLYDGTEGAAFDPCAVNSAGCAFSSSWLTMPQPARYPKSVNGPRTGVSDITESVYYPFDDSVPSSWRGRLAAVRNAAGHVVRHEDYDIFGNARRVVAPNGSVTESAYDLLGRPLSGTLKAVTGCDTAADPLCATDLVNRRMYDPPAGPLAIQVGPRGEATSYTYDGRGRTLEVVRGEITGSIPSTAAAAISAAAWKEKLENQYDATTGRKTIERYSGRDGSSWVVKKSESYAYDVDGRLTTSTHADSTAVHYDYDAGELASIQDENHASPNTFYSYDPAGRLATVRQLLSTAPGGEILTSYAYDRSGNLTSVTDPNGNVTTYVYDDFGQLIRQVSPVSGQTSYTYDEAGQLLTTTDANGAVTTRTYDLLGRALTATAVRGSSTETTAWSYDAGTFGKGQMSGMTDPSGSTAYQYDRRGLLLRETKSVGAASYTTSFGHDASGNRSSMTYPSGMVVTFAYDYARRPVSATAGTTALVTSATYLPFGPMLEVAYGNGTTRTMTYDQRYQPWTNLLSTSGGPIASYAYAHDAAGNITAIDDGANSIYSRTFGYDDLNRLVTANGGTSLWGAGSYTYDRMGNMQSATLGSQSSTFAYSGTTPRLTAVTTGGVLRSVSYDAAGNEIAAGTAASSYSPRNQLQVFDDSRYVYDGRGIRTVASTPSFFSSLVVPSEVGGGRTVDGTVTLDRPAPAGGAVVSLASNGTAATVPASMTIAAGETSGTFAIVTTGVTATQTVLISATYDGVTLSESLDVIPPTLASISLSSTLKGGQSVTGTVSLTADAPAGGAVITLTSSDPAHLAVPATVTIASGEDHVQFTASAPVAVPATIALTVLAEYGAEDREASVSILPPAISSLTFATSTLEGGTLANAVVTLESPAAAGTVVTFTSSSASLQAPAAITLSASTVTTSVEVATSPVASTTTGVLTAHLSPTSASASATLQAAAVTLLSFTITPTTRVGTNTVTGTVTLTATAPAGGLDVELSPYEDGLVPPFVTIPAGMTQATFEITTPQVFDNEVLTLRARHSVTVIERELHLLPPTQFIDLSRTQPGTILENETEGHQGGDPITFYESGPIASVTIGSTLIAERAEWSFLPGIDPTYEATTKRVTQPTDVYLTASSDDPDDMLDRMRVVLLPTWDTPFLQSVTMETAAVTGGANAAGSVTLSNPAPTGGITIALNGSRAGLAGVPASVTVPAGETVGSFTIATHPTTLTRGVLVTATYGAQTRTTTLSAQPPPTNPAIWTPVAATGTVPEMLQAEENIPGPMTSSSAISTSSVDPILIARHVLYTPELNLMMETGATNTTTKPILHEYIWFSGQPLAQISTQTGAIDWYFNDHLGTPILQTDSTATVTWRAEYEPYGKVFAVRAGGEKDQPLRFPGQEEDGELSYNIFRWYRGGWGRYTQSDPIELAGGINLFIYALASPVRVTDRLGLDTVGCDGYMWNLETKCELQCCAQHDACFDKNNCSSSSWPVQSAKCGCDQTAGCKSCNATAALCITKCNTDGDPGSSTAPMFYCPKQHRFIHIPGDFPDRVTAEKACEYDYSKDCKIPVTKKKPQPTQPFQWGPKYYSPSGI